MAKKKVTTKKAPVKEVKQKIFIVLESDDAQDVINLDMAGNCTFSIHHTEESAKNEIEGSCDEFQTIISAEVIYSKSNSTPKDFKDFKEVKLK